MSKIFFVIATLAIFCAVSCNAEVLVLKSPEELQDAIAAYPRLVVKFYAPWYYFLPSSSNPLVTDFSGVATASTWNLLGTPPATRLLPRAPPSNSPK
jgi:hypothetical protein